MATLYLNCDLVTDLSNICQFEKIFLLNTLFRIVILAPPLIRKPSTCDCNLLSYWTKSFRFRLFLNAFIVFVGNCLVTLMELYLWLRQILMSLPSQ